jgi:hypothetical protein
MLKLKVHKLRIPRQKRVLTAAVSILVVVLVIATVIIFYAHKDKKANEVNAAKYGTAKTACQVFPEDVANGLLNQIAEKKTEKSAQSISENTQTSQCSYVQKTPGADGRLYSATLTFQSPTTQASIETVKQAFTAARPKDAIDVTAYSEAGYWNYEKGELNFLHNNVWYIVNYGPDGEINRTLSKTQDMADLLVGHF